MFGGRIIELRGRITAAMADLEAAMGPTVPPSGVSRTDLLRDLRACDFMMAEVERLIGPVPEPTYPPAEKTDDAKPKRKRASA
jgi:hypothetical protein